MNPIKSNCWSCEQCNRIFRFSDHGKIEAEQCCKCAKCNTITYMEYVGVSNYECIKCSLEGSIKFHEESIQSSVERLRFAKNELEKLTSRNK